MDRKFRWLYGIAGSAASIGLSVAAIAATQTTLSDGAYSEAQAQRGRALYADNCASCHGAKLAGGGGPTLTGPFWSSWRGRSMKELYLLIQGSMPQNAPSSLGDKDYSAIIAYMAKVGGYRTGDADLSSSPEALGNIEIAPAK